MTRKLWAPLNPARRDKSFGTLGSPIRHTVPEILSDGKIPQQQQQQQEQEYIKFLRDRYICIGCKVDISEKNLFHQQYVLPEFTLQLGYICLFY